MILVCMLKLEEAFVKHIYIYIYIYIFTHMLISFPACVFTICLGSVFEGYDFPANTSGGNP